MAITAQMVRELRERSGAGMMECKKALEATSGNLEEAFDHLRKAGLKAADKKAGREMAEGRVHAAIADDGRAGGLIALTTETDFVVKSDDVVALVEGLARHAREELPSSADEMLSQPYGDSTVEEAVKTVSGKAGENMQLAGAVGYANPEGRVGAYVHHNYRVGVLVSLSTDADAEKADAFIKSLGMHVAAIKPRVLSRDDVDPAELEREKAIYLEEVKSKPETIQEKIVQGKLEKYFEGIVLLEQPWVMDDKVSVQKALERELGANSKIAAFTQFRIGQ